MVNSVKDSLNLQDTISTIKLMLCHDKETVCVIVEGPGDIKLFKPLLSDNVDLYQSYGSKVGIDKILTEYFDKEKRVIGIRDKDYLEKPVCDKSFFCDFCCAEMMIISQDSCFQRLYSNFYNKSEFDCNSLRLYCFEHLEWLSKLRKLNELNGYHIRFNGIKMGTVFETDIDKMNKNINQKINKINDSEIIDDDKIRLCREMQKCSCLEDYLNITNGHDFIDVFCQLCRSKHTQVNKENVEYSLISSFGQPCFSHTKLYKDILTYQSINELNILIES